MLGDPRRGQIVALSIVGAALLWIVVAGLESDRLFARLGMNMHAITYLAIVIGCFGGVAAAVLGRFAHVKADLLAGRDVVAAWHVDAATLASAARRELDADRAEKRGALMAVIVLIVLIFGAFGIFDTEAAPAMTGAGMVFAAVVYVAYRLGLRVQARHAEMRSGEVIVGRRGLLFNGVLHVWGLPLNWFAGATFSRHPSAVTLAYGYYSQVGPRIVSVAIPVPPPAIPQALRVVEVLNPGAAPDTRRSRQA